MAKVSVHERRTPIPLAAQLALALVCLAAAWYYALGIVATAPSQSGPAFVADMYPAWYATRLVLTTGGDPYAPEVTRNIQAGMYADASLAAQLRNQQRFAYPLYSVFFFAPFAAMPFAAVQLTCFLLCLALTALSVFWWMGRSELPVNPAVLILLLLAAYPVVLGTLLRQPSLLLAPLLAAVLGCLRSNRLVLAGVLAAVTTIKPQLAIPVLLPVGIWALAEIQRRKRFLVAAIVTEGALLGGAAFMMPNWLPRWLDTVRAYTQYAGGQPRLFFVLPHMAAVGVEILLLLAVMWVCWRWRESDLLFAVGFSIAVFQLIFPFQMYNEVLLLPPILWLLAHPPSRSPQRQLFTLLHGVVWVVLGWAWLTMMALDAGNLLHPGSAHQQPAFPMMSFWLLPYVMMMVLLAHAAARAPFRMTAMKIDLSS